MKLRLASLVLLRGNRSGIFPSIMSSSAMNNLPSLNLSVLTFAESRLTHCWLYEGTVSAGAAVLPGVHLCSAYHLKSPFHLTVALQIGCSVQEHAWHCLVAL